jgi:cyanophycin synthetase
MPDRALIPESPQRTAALPALQGHPVRIEGRPVELAGPAYGVAQPVLVAIVRLTGVVSRPWRATDQALAQSGGLVDLPVLPDIESWPYESTAAHLLMRWAVALQRTADLPVYAAGRLIGVSGKALDGGARLRLAVPRYHAAAAAKALGWAVQVIDAVLRLDATALGDLPASLRPLGDAAKSLLPGLRKRAPTGVNTLRFLRAAGEQDVPWRRLAGNVFAFGEGARTRWLDSSFTDRTSSLGANLSRNKAWCAEVLRSAGLPVPDHMPARDAESAVRAAERLGYPVVVKPTDLDRGLGVAADLRDAAEVRLAYDRAREHSQNVLVEKHVPGQDYRLVVFNGRLVLAILRVPGGVTGDGRRTVAQLVDALNADPRRGSAANSPLARLEPDETAHELLARAGLSLESVPAAGQFVRLRRAANVATGGVPVDVLASVHPDNRLLAERAAEALRLDLAGVDLLLPDISRSWLQTGAGICEVNAQPQFGVITAAHLYGSILRELVPQGGRIPIAVVIGGSDLALEVGRELQRDWQRHGLCVGLTSPGGTWIGERRVAPPAGTFFAAGRSVLSDPTSEAAVLVARPRDLLATGLPFDRCDAVVLADADATEASPIATARFGEACRMLLPHARGVVVANRADPVCLAAVERLRDVIAVQADASAAAMVDAVGRRLRFGASGRGGPTRAASWKPNG